MRKLLVPLAGVVTLISGANSVDPYRRSHSVGGRVKHPSDFRRDEAGRERGLLA